MTAKRPKEPRRSEADVEAWLTESIAKHQRLLPITKALLQNMLSERHIEFLSIAGRVKSQESATDKIKRKKYILPQQQFTDMSGIRVIVYLDSQVKLVSSLVRELFSVDEGNSLDKSGVLGADRVGYRSVHFVCNLGQDRAGLIEYKDVCTEPFEIQIRTVLQHAWAELTHERHYKFKQALPLHIERKINLHAGLLEVADTAFDEIASEIDRYSERLISESTETLLDEEISSISILQYTDRCRSAHGIPLQSGDLYGAAKQAVKELRRFGLTTIRDIDKLVDADFIKDYKKSQIDEPTVGFMRSLMMYKNLQKYFSIWGRSWSSLAEDDYNFLASKYGKRQVDDVLKQYDVPLGDDLE